MLVQELVELLVIDAMRSFDLAIEVGCPGANVDVPDVEALEVPVKPGLEQAAPSRTAATAACAGDASDSRAAGSRRARRECDAPTTGRLRAGESASDNR